MISVSRHGVNSTSKSENICTNSEVPGHPFEVSPSPSLSPASARPISVLTTSNRPVYASILVSAEGCTGRVGAVSVVIEDTSATSGSSPCCCARSSDPTPWVLQPPVCFLSPRLPAQTVQLTESGTVPSFPSLTSFTRRDASDAQRALAPSVLCVVFVAEGHLCGPFQSLTPATNTLYTGVHRCPGASVPACIWGK